MAGKTTSISFDLLAKDVSVSKTLTNLDQRSKKFIGTLKTLAATFGIAFSVTALVGAVKSVVGAYADAQAQQSKLADAFTRFPALADTNIKALQKLNTEIEHKTRFDDDALASGQAVLAQFGLTGQQLIQLTPLLADYAAKTGKDIPTASQDLGKALLGQGRGLKAIGVNFKDTGSEAGNFQELIDQLGTHVSGFAEKDADTAEGKLLNLQNRFGDIEENLGEALMPALSELADFTETTVLPALQDFSNWFVSDGLPGIEGFLGGLGDYSAVLGPAAVAIGVLTAAQWLLNIAMDANPVGAIILALEAGIALAIAFMTVLSPVSTAIVNFEYGVAEAAVGVARSIASAMQGFVNGAIDAINTLITPLNAILSAAGLKPIKIPHVNYVAGFDAAAAGLDAAQSQTLTGLGYISGAVPTPGSGTRVAVGGGSGNVPHGAALADGGVVSAATLALIGEGSESEVVAPLSKLPDIAAAAGIGGAAGGTFEGNLYLDSGQFLGLVRGEIQNADQGNVRISKAGKQS